MLKMYACLRAVFSVVLALYSFTIAAQSPCSSYSGSNQDSLIACGKSEFSTGNWENALRLFAKAYSSTMADNNLASAAKDIGRQIVRQKFAEGHEFSQKLDYHNALAIHQGLLEYCRIFGFREFEELIYEDISHLRTSQYENVLNEGYEALIAGVPNYARQVFNEADKHFNRYAQYMRHQKVSYNQAFVRVMTEKGFSPPSLLMDAINSGRHLDALEIALYVSDPSTDSMPEFRELIHQAIAASLEAIIENGEDPDRALIILNTGIAAGCSLGVSSLDEIRQLRMKAAYGFMSKTCYAYYQSYEKAIGRALKAVGGKQIDQALVNIQDALNQFNISQPCGFTETEAWFWRQRFEAGKAIKESQNAIREALLVNDMRKFIGLFHGIEALQMTYPGVDSLIGYTPDAAKWLGQYASPENLLAFINLLPSDTLLLPTDAYLVRHSLETLQKRSVSARKTRKAQRIYANYLIESYTNHGLTPPQSLLPPDSRYFRYFWHEYSKTNNKTK